jgi:uncharacterized membrane protein
LHTNIEPQPPEGIRPANRDERLEWLASALLISLILWLTAWELDLAPLRPGGSWMVLKVLPLLALLMGTVKQRTRSYQWGSIIIWIFACEGVVRGMSDPSVHSRMLGWGELAMSLGFFGVILMIVRARLRNAAS